MKDDEKVSELQKFVEDVCLGAEYQDWNWFRAPRVSRWVASPKLSLFGASDEHKQVIADVIIEINDALKETPIRIEALEPNTEDASLKVFFAPIEEFNQISRQHGFNFESGNLGYFWVFWNREHEIQKAIVLLATDRLQGKQLTHFALEEITQALGLMNDSMLFKYSIFYEQDGDTGNVTSLSVLDRQIIRFFYTHLKPGYYRADVSQAFKTNWSSDY